jgi:hypothetical protein
MIEIAIQKKTLPDGMSVRLVSSLVKLKRDQLTFTVYCQ